MEQASEPVSTSGWFAIQRRDFTVAYLLEGVTRDSSSVALRVPASYAFKPSLPAGERVAAGDLVGKLQLRPDVKSALEARAASSRLDAAELERLLAKEGSVSAPIAGTISDGTEGASIEAAGVDVIVQLSPIQALRYESLTFVGTTTVETVVGTREIECSAISVLPDQESADGRGEVGAELRCRLPLGVETTAGLRAQLKLVSEVIPDAIAVPNEYLSYDPIADGYTLTYVDGDREMTLSVDLGPSDGVQRVVLTDVPTGVRLVRPAHS